MKNNANVLSRIIGIITAVCLLATQIMPSIATANDSETLDSLLESAASGSSELLVGAAIQDITPTEDMFPLRWGNQGYIVGIIEDIHVRVIALNDGQSTSLILSFETGKGPYPPAYIEALAEHTGVDEAAIFWTATHSHAAPESKSNLLEEDSNYGKWMRLVMDRLLTAADEAIANMEPAEVGVGYADSYVNVNRNAAYINPTTGEKYRALGYNGGGYSDKLLTTVQFNSIETGVPIAFIVHYAVHGVVMHANQYFDSAYEGINYAAGEKYSDVGVMGIHPDLPGMVSKYLEENFAGSVALWISGAAGDQNPIIMNEIYTANPSTGEQEISYISGGSVEICEYLSKLQYSDVLRALDSIEEFDSEVSISNAFGETDVPGRDSYADVKLHLQLLRIGDIALVGSAGELFNSIGVYMRENSLLEHTLVVNHCWSKDEQATGYLCDDDGLINGGFGTTARYAVGYVNECLTDLMNNLIEETETWTYNEDGTAINKQTGEILIVGLDDIAGTDDDNKIVNPAGKVLLEDVLVSYDSAGIRYVSLGNGFKLCGGADGKLGTTDDIVKSFGSYQQGLTDSATTVQRKEALDWRLLDIKDGEAILSSEKIIDGILFNLNTTDGNSWKDSNYRNWLNSTGGVSSSGNNTGFYDTAFTNAEKDKIVLTDVNMNSTSQFIAYNTTKSSDWWEYYSTGGENTADYVWALSGEETFEYFGRSTIATYDELGHDPDNYTNGYFVPTNFAYSEAGVKINTGGNGPSFIGYADSWTRSPGRDVDTDGTYYGVFWGSVGSLNSGRAVNRVYGALPVITVDLGQDDSSWVYNGDGTATNVLTNNTVIVGSDEVAGTDDDNRIVNPAGTTLLENVKRSYDDKSTVYVDLGSGFKLYAGEDGYIGTIDDVVKGFGSYAQSDVTGEAKESLDWRLLDIKNGEAVLLSAKVIDAASYNLNATDGVEWKDSNLRNWLNSEGGVSNGGDIAGFYDAAFTIAEKEKINLTEVRMDYSDWEKWDKDGDVYNYQDTIGNFPGYDRIQAMYELYETSGEKSYDYVYAISGEEVFRYFDTSTVMNPEFYDLVNFTNGYFPLTAYALSQGAKYNSSALQWMFNGNADSWTRSAGRPAEANSIGAIQYYGTFWGSYGNMNTGRTVNTTYGVLPMINVNLTADYIPSVWKEVLFDLIAEAEALVGSEEYNNTYDFIREYFDEALLEAKEVYNNMYASDDEVIDAFYTLIDAIGYFSAVPADMAKLTVLVELAKGLDLSKYNVGVEDFRTALANGEAVLADKFAAQEEADNAYNVLLKAIAAMRYTVNKDMLQSLYNKVNGIDTSIYTEESVLIFSNAMTYAKAVLTNEYATQDEVDAAYFDLSAAYNGLALVVDDASEEENSKDSSKSSSDGSNSTDGGGSGIGSGSTSDSNSMNDLSTEGNSSAPKTGDFTPLTGIIILTILTGIMVLTIKKRKTSFDNVQQTT